MNKTEKKKIYTYYISNVMGDENKTNKYLVEIKFPVVFSVSGSVYMVP